MLNNNIVFKIANCVEGERGFASLYYSLPKFENEEEGL